MNVLKSYEPRCLILSASGLYAWSTRRIFTWTRDFQKAPLEPSSGLRVWLCHGMPLGTNLRTK